MQTFELEQDEQIILERRKHWFEYVFPVGGGIFNVFLPLILFGTLWSDIFGSSVVPGNVHALELTLYSFWILFIWIDVFILATNIYLDVLVITNRRIIDIEQKGLFSRTVSSVRFDRIQDITVEVKGIVPTLLHFGTLRIQTAGEQEEFIITYVHKPYEAKDFIMKEHHRTVENNPAQTQKGAAVA